MKIEMRKMKKNKKNKKTRIALRNLAALYNHTNDNRDFLFPELEEDKVQAI